MDCPGVRSVHTGPIPRIGGVAMYLSAIVFEIKGNIEPRQGHAPHHLIAMPKFGSLGAQKLAPRRGIKK